MTSQTLIYLSSGETGFMAARSKDKPVFAVAFQRAIEVLGNRSADSLIQDLKHYGVYFDDPEFDLHVFSNAINDLIGKPAANLIFERFVIELGKLANTHKIRK
jgi:hypothetical protein